MRLRVIAVGTRMPDWVQAAWHDFAKRMPKDCALELHEIKADARTQGRTVPQMMHAEAQRIEAAIPAQALRVILDEHGQDVTTMALAGHLKAWQATGSDVALIIGGPDGLDPALKQTARETLRLSSLTLPHAMVRVLLAEQI